MAEEQQNIPTVPQRGGLIVWVLVIGGLLLLGAIHGAFRTPRSFTSAPPAAPAASPEVPVLALDTLVSWSQDEQLGLVTYRIEDLDLVLSERKTTEGGFIPVLTLQRDGKPLLEVTGAEGIGRASAQIGAGKIDSMSDGLQILFTTFTGGAHCCAQTMLLVRTGETWRAVDLVTQDGAELAEFPKDYDGDGKRELQVNDDRFLYAFDAYAVSWAPPRFLQIVGGESKDVSKDMGFRPRFRAYLETVEPQCRAGQNGACAAYAAAAARAGLLPEAWPVILAAFQRDSTWINPGPCMVPETDEGCPSGARFTFDNYPEALRWFLGETGYLPPMYIPGPDQTGPSFGCKPTDSEVRRLICATPELAKADRELAWLRSRRSALSADPTQPDASDAAFAALRDAAPPDVFSLLRIYEAELVGLRAETGA